MFRFTTLRIVQLFSLLAVLMGLFASASAAGSSEGPVRQMWQLLDYVAVDYAGAVQDGAVVSQAEYDEMREFSARALNQAAALPVDKHRPQIMSAVDALNTAVLDKAPAGRVAALARNAKQLLLAAHPIEVAPRRAPDLKVGRTLYMAQCASCHGALGDGNGPLGRTLEPKPIAFTDGERARSRSLMALYQVVTQGVEGTSMPSFAQMSEAERWALAFYVGTLSYDVKAAERGAAAFAGEPSVRAALPDLTAITTATEAELAEKLPPSVARDALAYARVHPDIASVASAGIGLARKNLQLSLSAALKGERDTATKLALSAYLDGFEPLEAALETRNKQLLVDAERVMQLYRGAVAAGELKAAAEHAEALDAIFVQVEAELAQGGSDFATSFVGALTILLREGVEALLIVAAMIAFLKKSERPQALRYVHAGWVAALAAGLLTWFIATRVVNISGASREVTEGVSSLFAAVVLLSVGLWMHQKSRAGQWQAYLRHQLSEAMTKSSAWALFALAFIAVYREVFETVLFFSALAADGNGSALLGGLATGVVLLAAIAAIVLRTSARMPIGKFFAFSSVLVAVLVVVLVGKGVAGLQEAGWMSATPVQGLRLPVFGVYPTIQTYAAQGLVLLTALIGFGYNLLKARSLQQPQRI